jgi:hypothetical protein
VRHMGHPLQQTESNGTAAHTNAVRPAAGNVAACTFLKDVVVSFSLQPVGPRMPVSCDADLLLLSRHTLLTGLETVLRRHVVRRDAGANPRGVAAGAGGAAGARHLLHPRRGAGLDAGDASAGAQAVHLEPRRALSLHARRCSRRPCSTCTAFKWLRAAACAALCCAWDACTGCVHRCMPKLPAASCTRWSQPPSVTAEPFVDVMLAQDLMGAKGLNGIEGGLEEEGPHGSGGPPEGASATAAKRMVQAVQQFVAMLQIQQVGAVGTARQSHADCGVLQKTTGEVAATISEIDKEHPRA